MFQLELYKTTLLRMTDGEFLEKLYTIIQSIRLLRWIKNTRTNEKQGTPTIFGKQCYLASQVYDYGMDTSVRI